MSSVLPRWVNRSLSWEKKGTFTYETDACVFFVLYMNNDKLTDEIRYHRHVGTSVPTYEPLETPQRLTLDEAKKTCEALYALGHNFN